MSVVLKPLELPTAQMLLAETTTTSTRLTIPDPGLGLLTMLHFEPFQCSISVCAELVVLEKSPTAQMSPAETAPMPPSPLEIDPGLGLEMMLHFEPFQCSMSVEEVELLLEKLPTAQISLVETAATPLSDLNVGAPA